VLDCTSGRKHGRLKEQEKVEKEREEEGIINNPFDELKDLDKLIEVIYMYIHTYIYIYNNNNNILYMLCTIYMIYIYIFINIITCRLRKRRRG
jgi:hypothetical protein